MKPKRAASAALLMSATMASLHGHRAAAQSITIDGRLSPAQTLTGPNYSIGAGLGQQVGGNLFHSFGAFGLQQGESATFSGPASVTNVIGRITGGGASSINGAVNSSIPGANLYLVNPAGIIFGPNATINVSGSFHASSADYLRLHDGARFQATNPDASTLSAAPPEAFGFLSPTPQPVIVNGATLQTATGQTLGLVGGAMTVSKGTLLAPGGTIHISSAAGPGEIAVDPAAGPAPTVTQFGSVQIIGNSSVISDAGSVYIHGGQVSIAATNIQANAHDTTPGGVLSIQGDGGIAITSGGTIQTFSTGTSVGPLIKVATAAGTPLTIDSGGQIITSSIGAGQGGPIVISAGQLTLQNGAHIVSNSNNSGPGGPVSITAAALTIQAGASILSNAFNVGAGGPVTITAGNTLLDGDGTGLTSLTTASGLVDATGAPVPGGTGGTLSLSGGNLTIQNRALIQANSFGTGIGGAVNVNLTGAAGITTGGQIQVNANLLPTPGSKGGDAGNLTFASNTLNLVQGGAITGLAQGAGNAGQINVNVAGALVIDGTGRGGFVNGIGSENEPNATGASGSVLVNAANIAVVNGGYITSTVLGPGNGGPVLVSTPGAMVLDGRGDTSTIVGASATRSDSGNAGAVAITAGSLLIENGAQLSSATYGPGEGGSLTVNTGFLTLAQGGSITTDTFGSGNAGQIDLTVAGALIVDGTNHGVFNDSITSQTAIGVSGSAGSIQATAGSISVLQGGIISSTVFGSGRGGSIQLFTLGAMIIDGQGDGATLVRASALGPNSVNAGTLTLSAGSLTIANGAQVASLTTGAAPGGDITVNTGSLSVSHGGFITTDTFGAGNAGQIALNVSGVLTIDGTGKGIFSEGISSQSGVNAAGSAGSVQIAAGSVSILNGGAITSNTFGTGNGGSIRLTTQGSLTMDGQGDPSTEIAASALQPNSGNAGTITLSAGAVTLQNAAQITSSNDGPNRGGDVTLNAAALTLVGGGLIVTDTAGAGTAGQIVLNVAGALTIDGTNSFPFRNGVSSDAASGASGAAGSIRATAGNVSLLDGGFISSSTAGTGPAGLIQVTSPGAILLSGQTGTFTGISGSSTGPTAGDAGIITISAGTLTVQNGAQIASSSDGRGNGGNIVVTAANSILLDGPGPEITASSTGTGNAGSINIASPRITLRNGASISTAAALANGGNITIGPGELLYLQNSSITTSVNGARGNGGNIITDPTFVVLDHSQIAANAVGGSGGNVSIQAEALLASTESSVTASSQLGVQGTISLVAQPVNLNGSLVVLAGDLRSSVALLQEGCAARGANPRSSLLLAGRGGERQGLEAIVPALYFLNRPLHGDAHQASSAQVAPLHSSIKVTSGCG